MIKQRRKKEKSIFDQVDAIFKGIGSDKSLYHDVAFNGVNMKTIMDNLVKLFGKDLEGGSVCELIHVEDARNDGGN